MVAFKYKGLNQIHFFENLFSCTFPEIVIVRLVSGEALEVRKYFPSVLNESLKSYT